MKTSNYFHSGSVTDREQKKRRKNQSVDQNLTNSLAYIQGVKKQQYSVCKDVIQQDLIIEKNAEDDKGG